METTAEMTNDVWDNRRGCPSTSSSNHENENNATTSTERGPGNHQVTGTAAFDRKIDGATAKKLEACFMAGLNNISTQKNKSEVQALSKEFRVPPKHIKRWIHNRNRQGRPRTHMYHNRPRPYDGYLSVSLKGLTGEDRVQAMKEAPQRWKTEVSKNKDEVAKYKKIAEDQFQEKKRNMSEQQKSNMAKRLMNEAKKIIDQFGELGYASCIVASDGTRLFDGYTKTVQESTIAAIEKLLLHEVFRGESDEKQECVDRDVLRRKVRKMLNKKYVNDIRPLKRTTIPYNRLNTFNVEGLPDGVELKNPSLYDKKTLTVLLNHMPSIKFSAKDNVQESTMAVDTVQDEVPHEAIEMSPRPISLADYEDFDSDDAPLADEQQSLADHMDFDNDDAPLAVLFPLATAKVPAVTPAINPVKPRNQVQDSADTVQHKKSLKKKKKKETNKEAKKETKKKTKDKMYTIEEILDSDGNFFKVHWKGYPKSEATWEPRSNLPKELLNKFVK